MTRRVRLGLAICAWIGGIAVAATASWYMYGALYLIGMAFAKTNPYSLSMSLVRSWLCGTLFGVVVVVSESLADRAVQRPSRRCAPRLLWIPAKFAFAAMTVSGLFAVLAHEFYLAFDMYGVHAALVVTGGLAAVSWFRRSSGYKAA